MATELDKIDLEKFLKEREKIPENRRWLEKFEKVGVSEHGNKPQIWENCWNNIFNVVRSKRKLPGVYVIRDPCMNIVLVGRTEKGIPKRMSQHVYSPSSSNLNVMLGGSPDFVGKNREFLKKAVKRFEVYFVIITDVVVQKKVEKMLVDLFRGSSTGKFLLNKRP